MIHTGSAERQANSCQKEREHGPIITLLLNHLSFQREHVSAISCRASEEEERWRNPARGGVWRWKRRKHPVTDGSSSLSVTAPPYGSSQLLPFHREQQPLFLLETRCDCFGQEEVVGTNDARDLERSEPQTGRNGRPGAEPQTADQRQLRSQRNTGLRPSSPALFLRRPDDSRPSLRYCGQSPGLSGDNIILNRGPPKYLIFRILSAALRDIGKRQVGRRLKPEKPAALGAGKSRFLKPISSRDFRSHLLHPQGSPRSILMKLFARAYIIVWNISLTDPQFSRVNMKDETITHPRQPRPRSLLFFSLLKRKL